MNAWFRLAVAILAGLAGFLSVFPFSGADTDPPRYYSILGYRVPTDSHWLAIVIGVAVGYIVWKILRRAVDKERSDS